MTARVRHSCRFVERRALIRTMFQASPVGDAPRIHGELRKLGIAVSQSTVVKYMVRRPLPPSQTWRTFLGKNLGQVMAADLFVVPTVTYRLLFVLVILAPRTSMRRACRSHRFPVGVDGATTAERLGASAEPPFGDLPLVVLARGVDTGQRHHALQAKLALWSRNSRHTVVEGAGHEIHLFQPHAVVTAIQDVIAAAQSGKSLATP
jgi:pimeloyl-ACP methyl ester carboxylesterase